MYGPRKIILTLKEKYFLTSEKRALPLQGAISCNPIFEGVFLF